MDRFVDNKNNSWVRPEKAATVAEIQGGVWV